MRPPFRAIAHHLHRHVGAGIVCSVGYFDPGNWSVDIQAGATFGYRPMLFVILLSGIVAVLFQVLATRLGCVTGLDLATHCRILWHDHPKYPRLVRFLLLYPLYILVELAIIATDLAELLGSAIGITLLAPALPVWACVLLTALDVFVFLLIADHSHAGRPIRFVEAAIFLLVAAISISFIVLIVEVKPFWPHVFIGFVPSKSLFSTRPNAIYTAISIVGATIMPHSLFLGSHFGTQDRLSSRSALSSPVARHPSIQATSRQRWRAMFSVTRISNDDLANKSKRHGPRCNNSLSFVQGHLAHATVDIVFSLLVVAVPINSAILILAAAVQHGVPAPSSVGISTVYELVLKDLGKGAASLFGLALVFSGQAASVTTTFAGQVVSEGFITWNISPLLRRLVTRTISLIPSVVVAMAFDRAGLNTLLVASQVALSVVLPLVAFPLIYLTSSKTIMSVNAPRATKTNDRANSPTRIDVTHQEPTGAPSPQPGGVIMEEVKVIAIGEHVARCDSQPQADMIDFSNSYITSVVAYLIWLVVFVANTYGIIMLG